MIKFTTFNIIIIAIAIILTILLIAYLSKTYKIFENFNDSSKLVVEYYYNDNCSYCKSFNDEWNKFIHKVDKSKPYKYKSFSVLNEDNNKRAHDFDIKGTPAIIITKNDKLFASCYNGERTAKELIEYVDRIAKIEKFANRRRRPNI